MKRYKLKRDLPTFELGDKFILKEGIGLQHVLEGCDGAIVYTEATLEKFPNILTDWFEEIKPSEPLIKQEKIRKAVRVWAEANEISQAKFDRRMSGFSASDAGHNFLSMISFDGFVFNCEDGKYYTIAELCGEEEE